MTLPKTSLTRKYILF